MLDQPSITSEVKPHNCKDWDDADEVEVTLIMTTKNKTKAFKGIIYKKVGVNKIE